VAIKIFHVYIPQLSHFFTSASHEPHTEAADYISGFQLWSLNDPITKLKSLRCYYCRDA